MSYNKNAEVYEGYIYKVINSVDNKVYIGQTSKTIEERWNQHKYEAINKKDNVIFHNAIRKYGIDKFKVSLIIKLEANSLEELKIYLDENEINYIKLYNSIKPNGYNIASGGNENNKRNFLDEKYLYKKVVQYNSFLEKTNIYENAYIASIHNNISTNYIFQCCLGKRLSFENYIYRFEEDSLDKYNIKIYGVTQYDMSGNFIKRWFTPKECELYYNMKPNSISKSIARGTSCYGFIFSKYNNQPKIPKTTTKKVYQYNKDYNLVKIFDKISDANIASGYCSKNVGDFTVMLKSHDNFYNNYYWIIDDTNYKQKGG